jgi:probable phosphoglycerate mutase
VTLYVTRHGETDYNVQKRYAGSTNIPLNANGLRQAEKLAHDLSSVKFDVIVSSPLLRARQTAETIQKLCDVPIIIINEFTEINMGVYEGLTREEAHAQYPDIWAKLSFDRLDDAPTGGETYRQVDTRVSIGITKIKDKYSKSKVLLVCHAFTARIINRQLSGLSFEDMHTFMLGNCEIAEYTL